MPNQNNKQIGNTNSAVNSEPVMYDIPTNNKLIKKAEEIIDNYAHDYRDMAMSEYILKGVLLSLRYDIFKLWEGEMRENKLEQLAELEHEQWEEWSKNIASNENISQDKIDRWRKLWIPYKDLSENAKDQDRTYARKVLSILSTNPNKEDE